MARPAQPLPTHPDVTVETEQRVWSGRFPVDVVLFRHRRFDGSQSRSRRWELWRRGAAAALLPYDPASDSVVLIEQVRLPAFAAGFDPVLVELPAGLCEPDEPPEACIAREMQEEMHLSADRVERIGCYLVSPGGTDEHVTLFAGRVTAPPAGADGIAGYAGEAVEDEDIRIRVWPAAAAIEAALAGRFTNILTVTALFWLAVRRDALRSDWTGPAA
jgi:ADP-ribose pyrophosphatase